MKHLRLVSILTAVACAAGFVTADGTLAAEPAT